MSVAGAGMRRSAPAQDACRDVTTHVIFEPLDYIVRLAALVPESRVNLTRTTVYLLPTANAGLRRSDEPQSGIDPD